MALILELDLAVAGVEQFASRDEVGPRDPAKLEQRGENGVAVEAPIGIDILELAHRLRLDAFSVGEDRLAKLDVADRDRAVARVGLHDERRRDDESRTSRDGRELVPVLRSAVGLRVLHVNPQFDNVVVRHDGLLSSRLSPGLRPGTCSGIWALWGAARRRRPVVLMVAARNDARCGVCGAVALRESSDQEWHCVLEWLLAMPKGGR